MSYDPPRRALPPRQGGWPQATPPRAWPAYPDEPAYRDDSAYREEPAYQGQPVYQDQAAYQGQPVYQDQARYQDQAGYRGQPAYGVAGYYGEPADGFDHRGGGYGVATDEFDGGYGYGVATDEFDGAEDRYGLDTDGAAGGYGLDTDGAAGGGYGLDTDGAAGGYGLDTDGAGGEQRDWDYYAESRPSGPMLMAPDAGMLPHHWQSDRDRRQEQRRRGVLVGAVTGFLAAAVAIGVTTLAAAVVRPPASPVVAVANVFIDRTPAALKNLVVAHFGPHGRTVLLLGMYVIIALLAMALGVLTRRAPALGVAGIGAGAVVAAFVTITRPQGGAGGAVPWVIGGIAGVAALLWLVRASAPAMPARPVRPARGGNRRRA